MRTTVQKHSLLKVGILVVTLTSSVGVSHAQTTNWVAYNDMIPNYGPAVNGWITHPRTTGIDMGEAGGTGNLTNFLDGQQLPVVMSSFHTGATHSFGLAVAPSDNTPVAALFKGIVDVSNEGSAQPAGNLIGVQFSQNDYATITFSGLNPDKRYIFRGTAARGGPYGLRWTVATIIGAQTWVDAHINGNGGAVAGVYTSNTYPASLGAGQAAWNAGDNRPGAVIGWDFITPAADGTFSIQSSNYVGQIPGGTAANNTYSYAINAMLLAEVEVAAPVITQQPAAQTTVEQNRPFSLSVGASGTPLFYQWYKKGTSSDTAIAGATFATYSVSQAALNESGDYYVVVYNPLDSKTSTLAHVTVNADVTGPGIATAFSYPTVDFATQAASLNQVMVEFNERIQSAGATDPARYVISGGIGNPVSVILTNDSTVALQLSTALAEDTVYTVQVNGIIDIAGNNIANGGTNNPATFRSWVSGPGNGLMFEVYDNIGAGETVPDLTSSPLYPDHPTFRTNLSVFDSRQVFPDDTRVNYGTRIRGVFIPPVSGDWLFYMRGIDRCDLYLNPNGLDASGKQFLRDEQQPDNDGNWGRVVSSPVSLRAGRGYYIETLHKVDSGSGFIKVAARLLGTGTPPGVPNTELDTNAVYGAAIGAPLAPRDLGGALAVTQGPNDVTAEENHIATFTVQVSNPTGLPVFYKWFRDGTPIDGASGQSYSFEATSADSGATFRVEAAKLGSLAASGSATLSVVPDTTPPHPTNAVVSYTNATTVIVTFDEFVTSETGGDAFSYGSPDFAVLSASLDPDRKTAIITIDTPLIVGQSYEIDVSNVFDLSGNGMPETIPLTFVAGGDLPRLRIDSIDAYYADVSWPASYAGFILEQADTPTGSWTPAGTATVINGRNVVSIYFAPGNKFYRLRQ